MRKSGLPIIAALLLAPLPLAAATVYKTVGPDGHVTYSDQPPPQGQPATRIEIRDYPVGQSASEMARLQQMRETTDRMREDRLARERERAPPPELVQIPYEPPADARDDADDGDEGMTPYYPYSYPDRPYRGHHRPYPPYIDRDPGPHPAPASRGPGGLLGKIRSQY